MVAVRVDNIVKIWDVGTGRLISTLSGHDSPVYSLDFSPDGTKLLTGDPNGALRLWEVYSGKELTQFNSGNSYYRAVFSPDGKWIASADQDGTIRLWDIATVTIIKTLSGHKSNVKIITFSPDGRVIASGADDNTVRFWDSSTGRELGKPVESDFIERFAFSPDGKRLVTGGMDGSIKLWDVVGLQEVITLRNGGSGPSSITFSKNGSALAVGGKDGTISVWQAANLSGAL
jgi:WD40 repeat protein